ncbi:MAG: hypothetical protein ACLUYV_02980, partial [Alistipes shahii]
RAWRFSLRITKVNRFCTSLPWHWSLFAATARLIEHAQYLLCSLFIGGKYFAVRLSFARASESCAERRCCYHAISTPIIIITATLI